MDYEKKCKFCNKTFSREHIWLRHQFSQCPLKSKSPPNKPDFRKQIENSELLIKQLKDNNSPSTQAEKLNEAMIMLKNSNSYYKFKCTFCNEGFEFNNDLLLHKNTCFHKPAQFKPDPIPQLSLDTITKQLILISNDLKDMKQKIIEFRQEIEIVQQVKQQLLDLKEIAFHLRLFKMSSLKSTTQ